MTTAATASVSHAAEESKVLGSSVIPINESETKRRQKLRKNKKIEANLPVNVAQLYKEKLICGGLVPTEIRRSPKLSDGLKSLIGALIEMQATMPEVRPSIARLAMETSKGPDQVRRLIREGEKLSILRVTRRKSQANPSMNDTNLYEILYNPEIFEAPEPAIESPAKKKRERARKKQATRESEPAQSTGESATTTESGSRGTCENAGIPPSENARAVLANPQGNSNITAATQGSNTRIETPPPSSHGGGGDGSNSLQSRKSEGESLEWHKDVTQLYPEDLEAIRRIERKTEVGLHIERPRL